MVIVLISKINENPPKSRPELPFSIFFVATTQFRSVDAHKGAVKSDRKIKEMEFNAEENKKNLDRMSELVEKLQGKIRT